MLLRLLFITVFFCLTYFAAFAEHQLILLLKDARTNESLIGANVMCIEEESGAATDLKGRLSFNLSSTGLYTFAVSYLGYKNDTLSLLIDKDTSVIFQLYEMTSELDVVEVHARNMKRDHGIVGVTREVFDKIPTIFGEREVVRSIQLLPGVQSGSEGSSAIFVRGGGSDQNLVTLDDVPLFNLSHLFGMFSVFNSDVIESADLYLNYIPSQMSSRLASAIAVKSKNPTYDKTHFGFQIGMLNTKLYLETPIVKDKLSVQFAARGSYAGIFIKPVSKTQYKVGDESGYVSYYFYDLNAALNYKLNPKNTLSWNFFFTDDRFVTSGTESTADVEAGKKIKYSTSDKKNMAWRNAMSSIKHQLKINNNLFLNHQLFTTNYVLGKNKTRGEVDIKDDIALKKDRFTKKTSSVHEYGYYIGIDWLRNNHALKVGTNLSLRGFNPDKYIKKTLHDNKVVQLDIDNKKNTLTQDYSIYLDYYLQTKFVDISTGIRGNLYFTKGYRYKSLLPRLSVELKLPKSMVIQLASNFTEQNLHMVMGTVGDIVNEFWLPATAVTPVQKAQQYSMSFRQNISSWYWSMGGFYRAGENQVEYNSSTYSLNYSDWKEGVISKGNARAYGLELYLTKEFRDIYISASYNLSKSERKFDQLNRGRWYPYNNDRRHDASFLFNYKLNAKLDFSVMWVFGSGRPYQMTDLLYPSLELVKYYDEKNPESPQLGNLEHQFRYFDSRNNKRLTPFHHLDISMNYKWKKKKWTHGINLSIYNVYNRKNVFDFIIREVGSGDDMKTRFQTITLLPIMPSFSYEISF